MMTISRSELDEAAAEGLGVCLDCGTVQPGASLPDEQWCAVCGQDAVYSARLIQRCFDFVEEEEE
jgi:hypothetical protein